MNNVLVMLMISSAMRIGLGAQPFLDALLRKNGSEAERLLREGNLTYSELSGQPWHRTTPLIVALNNYPQPFEDIALTLIEKGVRFGGKTVPASNTALHLAVQRGLLRVAEAMLKRPRGRELLEARNGDHLTPLQLLVSERVKGDVEKGLLVALLKAGANANAETNTCAPLHWTAQNWDEYAAHMLLAHGADVRAKYAEYEVPMTPLELILTFQDNKMLQWRCAHVYVYYGAELTPEIAEDIAKRAYSRMYKFVTSRTMVSFDDFILGFSGTTLQNPSTTELTDFYDEWHAYAKYRIFRALPLKFEYDGPSAIESRQFEFLKEMGYKENLPEPRKWEMRRYSYNMALASIQLRHAEHKEIMARKTMIDLTNPMNLYVLNNGLRERKGMMFSLEVGYAWMEEREDGAADEGENY